MKLYKEYKITSFYWKLFRDKRTRILAQLFRYLMRHKMVAHRIINRFKTDVYRRFLTFPDTFFIERKFFNSLYMDVQQTEIRTEITHKVRDDLL